MEALTRILATGGLSQVTVSPIELKALGKAIDERARRVNQAATAKVARPDVGADYAAPSDPVESMLVEAWGDLLGVENIGVNDDFFDLGGHSLIAVRLFNRVKKAYGVELGLAVLFEAPTIAKLAAIIRAEAGITPEAPDAVAPAAETAARPARSSWSALVPIQTEGNGTPLFCVHGMNGNVLNFRDLAVRLGKDRPFYGLQAVGLNGVDKPHETIEEMASHYIEEMRRVQPRGPYLIAGYSGGGLVAFEMAHQLRAAGEEVALLAMLDTFAPTFLHKTSLDRVWWFLRGVRANGAPFVVRWLRVKARRRFLRLVRGAADMPLAREQLPADSQTVDLGDAFVAAQNRYILRPLADVPVDMFRATLRAEDGYVPRDMGWGPYALGGVRVWEVPGGHESMCLEPNVHVLSAHLRQAIERATRTERVGVA
jgi:thioesterase domain-containing protein/acyl carrier protein